MKLIFYWSFVNDRPVPCCASDGLVVEGLNPKWVVLENVTGMTSAGGGAAVDAILTGLKELGYHVEKKILRAEEYGVPQERRRIVFLGNRMGLPVIWPEALRVTVCTVPPGLFCRSMVWTIWPEPFRTTSRQVWAGRADARARGITTDRMFAFMML